MVSEIKKISSLTAETSFFKETSIQTFTDNYVIHAYEQGIKKGKQDKMIELAANARREFIKNRDDVVETIFRLVVEMISQGLNIKRGWIRSEINNDFDAIIAVPQVNFHSREFDQFFIKVNELEILSNSKSMHLNIWFMNNDKQINEEALYNDGFDLKLAIQKSHKSLDK